MDAVNVNPTAAQTEGPPPLDWRSQIPPDGRSRLINKILGTLKRRVSFNGEEEKLRQIATRFENKIFSVATSQSDYLRTISLKMRTVESKPKAVVPSGSTSLNGNNRVQVFTLIRMEDQQQNDQRQNEDGYSEYSAPAPRKRKKVPRKRKRVSKVWNEFEVIKNERDIVISAKCMHCKLVLVAGSTSGTSHLKRHLKRCPSRPEGLPIWEGGDDEEGDAYVFDMEVLRKEILFYVVEGNHSLSTVEEKGFRRMMYCATHEFVPFSRATLTRDLLAYYYLERERLKKKLIDTPGHICLTTNDWKSSNSGQSYICITAHFVDHDWKLHKRILRFRGLSPPFDGVNIAEEIWLFLNQWHLEHKVLSLTVDNATYNDSMIGHLKTRLSRRGMLVGGGRFFHIRCCAHIVNLVVQSGLNLIEDTLDSIRKLVKMIRKSNSRRKEFFDLAKNFGLNDKRRLSLDMKIRWNSSLKMLQDVLYFKDVFVSLGSTNTHFKPLVPCTSDWDKLGVIQKILNIFYDVTCLFSAVKTPTSNLYLKGAFMVHQCLLDAKHSPHPFQADMVERMLKKFDKYWCEYNINISCVAILDPRLKVKFVEYCLSKVFGGDVAERRVKEVLDTLRTLYSDYKLQGSLSPVVPPPTNVVDHYNMFDDFESFRPKSTSFESRKSQLDLYLDEPRLEFHSNLDVLEFWRSSAVRYPELSVMARDLLTIPVSSVASEAAFSIGGKTISPNRSSLKPKTVQALICVQDWRREDDELPLDIGVDYPDDEKINESENEDGGALSDDD